MAREHILIKVYAHLWPIRQHEESAVLQCLTALMPLCEVMEAEEVLSVKGDLLRIAFEGIYFPIDELIQEVVPFLHLESQGKIDYIDLEEWRLTRYTIQGQHIDTSCAPLN